MKPREKEQTLAISEIFGPTIQGEGIHLGKPAIFMRLAGCNLACVWCDTPYTWDWKNYDPREEIDMVSVWLVVSSLQALAKDTGVKHLVITGGEPLLQWQQLLYICQTLRKQGWYIEIETAGTVAPNTAELADLFNVSPKLANSGNPIEKRYKPDAIAWFQRTGRAAFKFVIANADDLYEVDQLVLRHNLSNIILMPEGRTAIDLQERAKWLAPLAIERGWRITSRLHVEIWGNERGH